jgi:hypothetical protein
MVVLLCSWLAWLVRPWSWLVGPVHLARAVVGGSAAATAGVLVGLLLGLLTGTAIGFFNGSWWGWLFFEDQYYLACVAVSRALRPRIQSALDAALDDPLVTRRFVEFMNAMARPKTGIDFVRYRIGAMSMVRALQHPEAAVALAHGNGRDRVATFEARLSWRIYTAQLRTAWATARGDKAQADRISHDAAILMRALHELVTVREHARALRATLHSTADLGAAESRAARFLQDT